MGVVYEFPTHFIAGGWRWPVEGLRPLARVYWDHGWHWTTGAHQGDAPNYREACACAERAVLAERQAIPDEPTNDGGA